MRYWYTRVMFLYRVSTIESFITDFDSVLVIGPLTKHHQKRCSSDNSLSTSKEDKKEENGVSRVNSIDANDDSVSNNISTNQSEESANARKDEMPSSFRFWVIFLWAFSGVGFLVFIFLVYSGHRRRGTRLKHGRRRRSLHTGFMETNGRDRHSRGVEVPL